MRIPSGKLIIAGALLALGAVACGDTFQAGAAVVNGNSISTDELEARVLAAGQGQPADDNLRRQALQQLIEESLMRQEAARRGLDVPDEQVEQQLSQIQSQFPSEEQFREALEQRGFTIETLKEAIRDQLARDLLSAELAGDISDADLREVYETDADQFTEVRARHILIRVEDPSQDEAARREAARLARQIRNGADFAELARENSDDPGSAAEGGDLGFFSLGDLVPEFAQAASGAKIGEIVGPVRTQFGYHVIEVLGRRVTPFEEAREQLRAQLEQQLGQTALGDFLEQALETATIRINPRYGQWDEDAKTIVPHESFVPASPAPDVLQPPSDFFQPPG